MLATLLPQLTGCSLVVQVEECEDNSQCILEDGTELVCGVESTCIEAPALGETCLSAQECLEPMLCVSKTQGAVQSEESEEGEGFCAMGCAMSSCEDAQGVPAGWTCCELSDGSAACLPDDQCGS